MKLQIEPLIALCDERVSILISNLHPYSKVKICATMCLPWAKDVKYESFAWYTTDSFGNIDLSKQKPDSGTYDYADCMGPIVSMKSNNKNAVKKIGKNISIDESLFINLSVKCGQEVANFSLERLFISKEIKRQKITDDFVGEFFYTENNNNRTIIFIGGSGSGLDVNRPIAALLASHGFNVLSLPFFGEKGLLPRLSKVPLEYFEKAFEWISKNPVIINKEINLYAVSKGAEVALILASRYPFISKVAALAPNAYCFQGIDFKNASSWTYQGKQLPYIRLKNRWFLADLVNCFIKNVPFGFTYLHAKGVRKAKNKEEARIKIENSKADLLLVTTKDCNMWNTFEGTAEIVETLRKYNYQKSYDLVIYDNAGEPYYAPYIIPACEIQVKFAPRLVLSMGGTMKGNAHACEDSWVKAIEFFKK